MDAVNELKGECKHKDTDTRTDAIYFRRSDMFGNYYYYGNDFPFHNEFVCTRKEFNDLVSQLETNFGVCELTYAKYKRAVTKSTKELQVMDEESNQCKISNLGNLLHNMSCSMDDEDEQNEFGGYASFCWYLADELRKSECAVDTTKLVFTQAMADNGELPVVGMECMIKLTYQDDNSFNKGYINGYSQDKKWLVFTDYLGNLEQLHIDKGVYSFKPINTRTDKEKLFDQINSIPRIYIDDANELVDKIILGRIHGVKWVGE